MRAPSAERRRVLDDALHHRGAETIAALRAATHHRREWLAALPGALKRLRA